MSNNQKSEKRRCGITSEHLHQIAELAQSIRFGSITLVFQDGILVQIEKVKTSG